MMEGMNPLQQPSGLNRPPLIQGSPQQSSGPMEVSTIQSNPQQLGGSIRPFMMQGMNPSQQFGGPMRPPMMQGMNPPQQPGGLMRPPMLQGINPLQHPRGLMRPPMMQGMSSLQQRGGLMRPPMMQGMNPLQQPRGPMRPPMLQSNSQQLGGSMRPPMIQGMNHPQQFGAPMRPPIMQGMNPPQQSGGLMRPPMLQGIQQQSGELMRPLAVQGNLQQVGRAMRPPMMLGMNRPQQPNRLMKPPIMHQLKPPIKPPLINPQQFGSTMRPPMMQNIRPQMPIASSIEPQPLVLGAPPQIFQKPSMDTSSPSPIEGFQQTYSNPQEKQQSRFSLDMFNNGIDLPDRDSYENNELLEPLNTFDTEDSHIQLNYTQLFSFHVSYNILDPTGQPQGRQWKTCILEVDFLSHIFRLQYNDRIVNSKPFFAWQNHNMDYQSDDMLRSPLVLMWFSTEQWHLVTQNREEKRCLTHVLECVGDNLKAEECISSADITIVGIDPKVLKFGLLTKKKSGTMSKNNKCYAIAIIGKFFIFKTQQIIGQHVYFVTSLLDASIRMVQGLEFEIIIPGIKSINLIAVHVEEMTEWMGAIGRSVDLAKEKISNKYIIRTEANDEGHSLGNHSYYHEDDDCYNDEDLEFEDCYPNINTYEYEEDDKSQKHHNETALNHNQDNHKQDIHHQHQNRHDYFRFKDDHQKNHKHKSAKRKQNVGSKMSRRRLIYEPKYKTTHENIDINHNIHQPHDNALCSRGGGGVIQLFIENGGCSGNQNTSQAMAKFQPYITKIPKMSKFAKIACSSKDRIHGYKSSSSSEDEKHPHSRILKQNHFIDYRNNGESNGSCDEGQHSKYNKYKHMISKNCDTKKLKQQCNFDRANCCDSKEFYQNEIQSHNTKDCCNLSRNECLQCKYPQNIIKNCCTSSENDCRSFCCGYPNCLMDVGSTINHFRSNNLSTNSHYKPRRYPASWTPLHGRSCSPPDEIVKNACIIQECNDSNECNDECYEGDCNVIRGGVAQKHTPTCTHTSESGSCCSTLIDELKLDDIDSDDDSYVIPSYLQHGWQEHKNERGDRFYYHAATKRFSLFPPSVYKTLTDFNPRDDVDI